MRNYGDRNWASNREGLFSQSDESTFARISTNSLTRSEFPLVVVGAKDGLTVAMPSLASASRTGTVLQTGYISDGELRWFYANCATFVFPSLDEGFGLPVLEAADNRAPMALSRIPAFQEFGDVGSFFDPTDAKSIADAVTESILNGPSAGAGGLTMRFSWAATVARIRESLLERV